MKEVRLLVKENYVIFNGGFYVFRPCVMLRFSG